MYYPLHLDISYNNDAEYRAAVRELMSMKPPVASDSDGASDSNGAGASNSDGASDSAALDAVTSDEMDMDADAMTVFLDFVYRATKTDDVCMTLYRLAAATMLSEDPSIGLAVLCSYSYLHEFHQAMRAVFLNIQSADNPALQALIARLGKR